MFQTLSYQLYSAAEQHPSDLRTGEAAAGLRDLRIRLGHAFGSGRRARSARAAAHTAARPVRVLTSGR